ncbi:unnamed protein product [Closterium sp. Naga37s-1]|nr:unnamed protein product [Closterium sp. Naga37s-1]
MCICVPVSSLQPSFPPAHLSAVRPAIFIWLNNFTGSFPSQFSDLVNLEYFYARENALQGSIPATLGRLTSLTIIQLGGNKLTGSIPDSFSNLGNLQGFYLWQNQLNGSLDFLTHCYSLEQIAIQYNQFTGSIHSDIWMLDSLNHFDVSSNKLTGAIPASVGELVELTTFNVSHNTLTGYLPASMIALTKLEDLYFTQDPPGLLTCPPSDTKQCAEVRSNDLELQYCSASGSKDSSGQAVAGATGAVERPAVCRQYRLDVLAAATGMWAEANKIGSGGFGDVYRAHDPADPSTPWAVKRAKVLTNDFRREVNEMASKHHPHLVRLLGFCVDYNEATEQTEQILIYEFMPNGDLERWLGPGMGDVHSFGVHMYLQMHFLSLPSISVGMRVQTRTWTLTYSSPFVLIAQSAIFTVIRFSPLPSHSSPLPSLFSPLPSLSSHLPSLPHQVAPFIAANDGVTFKDPALEAPPEIILRMARLALSCTTMPTAHRPNLINVLAELEALREEVCGATRNRMARRIDREIDDKQGHSLEEEVANAIRIGSSGGGGESRKHTLGQVAAAVSDGVPGGMEAQGLLSQSLTGFLPASVGAATRLSKIGLYNNILSGSIPDTIGNLLSLQYLDLSANNFSGGLPAAIGKLSLLTYL